MKFFFLLIHSIKKKQAVIIWDCLKYDLDKYDFKPASVVKSEQAELTVGSSQDVSITLPNVEGSSTQSTKFSGCTKSYAPKECLMIIDPQTGKITLERLSANVRVKNVRMENRPTLKSTIPRTNAPETQTDKKSTKATTTTTTTNKSTTQKLTNPNKQTVNAPVKPMPNKKALSPMDDRLSDEESSPESAEPVPAQTNVTARRPSHTTLEQDLQLSDTTDEET